MAPKKTTTSKSATVTTERKSLGDLKTLDRTELARVLESARRELYILTMKKNLGELKQPHFLKAQRQYIAQISTFLTSSI
ncbi:MAG: 50S ribosomal protein L29 [Burkholderiaceae bacterium]|jgi:ribosomal protein L29|nr:50S ribosomal protein L29 [Burkholderiaceae bacterium]